MENLKTLVHGDALNSKQLKLAQEELKHLEKSQKEANEFIKTLAEMVGIETDLIGFDEITLSLDDFEEALKELYNESKLTEKDITNIIIRFFKWKGVKSLSTISILEIETFAKEYVNEF